MWPPASAHPNKQFERSTSGVSRLSCLVNVSAYKNGRATQPALNLRTEFGAGRGIDWQDQLLGLLESLDPVQDSAEILARHSYLLDYAVRFADRNRVIALLKGWARAFRDLSGLLSSRGKAWADFEVFSWSLFGFANPQRFAAEVEEVLESLRG